MYRLFARYWKAGASVAAALAHTRHRRFGITPMPVIADRLPDAEYVAVKVYFSRALPQDAANRRAATDLVRRLADRRPVVLLTTGLALDEHRELDMADEIAAGP